MSSRPPAPSLGLLPELSLAGLTVAAVAGLGRLFADGSFLAPLLLCAVGAHALAGYARRARWPSSVALAACGLGLVLYVAWVLEPGATRYGLPGPDTWHAVTDDLSAAWQRFGRAVAPVPAERGFLLAAAIAIWISAVIADWAAFRLGTAFEAMVPSFAIFVFAAALGADRSRAAYTGLYLAAVLGFLLVHGASRRAESTAWFASRLRGGPRAIVQGGLALGVCTVLAAMVIGPLLPGAEARPLVDWRNRDRHNDSRVTVSPLVDIRSRLVEQSNVEVFTVKSTVRAYWRLTSLDSFDGQVWGSKGSYRRATSGLPDGDGSPNRTDSGIQEFSIESLESPWLPAAFRPDGFEGPANVSFDPDSGSLLTDQSTAAGMVYRVRSLLPELTRGELDRVPLRYPGDIGRKYLQLPARFPVSVSRLARQVTAGTRTPYDKAIALQDWFRTDFVYDLNNVPSGHSDSAIEQFLTDRRGYCEQFAGTYAAMMRTLGVPARVAVGFTPGRVGRDGLYHVTGRQAHAWPEVWFDGIGWVPFEPTPGRGAPGAEAYTGVAEQQDTSTGPAGSTATTVPGANTTIANETSPTLRPQNGGNDLLAGDPFEAPAKPSPWGSRLQVLGLGAAALLVLWLVGVPLAHLVRRRRRRSRAHTPGERTLAAWDGALEALALAGVARRPAETHAEYTRRASSAVAAGTLDGQLDGLAAAASAAAFAPGEVPDEVAERAEVDSAGVIASVHDRAGWLRRVRWALDPRPLLPRRGFDRPSVWTRLRLLRRARAA